MELCFISARVFSLFFFKKNQKIFKKRKGKKAHGVEVFGGEGVVELRVMTMPALFFLRPMGS